MYLLDTDTLSNLMKRSPSSKLVRLMQSVPAGEQFTSSISLGGTDLWRPKEGFAKTAEADPAVVDRKSARSPIRVVA